MRAATFSESRSRLRATIALLDQIATAITLLHHPLREVPDVMNATSAGSTITAIMPCTKMDDDEPTTYILGGAR
jgi:hypothetical protein